MAAIYFYQKVNGWSLRHLGHREKRIVPYAMTIASYIVCLLLMYRMGIHASCRASWCRRCWQCSSARW